MKDRQELLTAELATGIDRTGAPGDQSPRRRLDAAATRLAAIAAALLVVVFLVVTVSRAAFVATTDNTGNSLATGTIALSDDDSGTAMFSSTNLVPGNTVTHCIVVTYTGSLDPTAVKLYISGAPTGTLATYLDLVAEVGTGGTYADCTGFTGAQLYNGTLAGFATSHTNYANGLTGWDPTGTGESRVFKFTLTVQDQSAAAGTNAGFGFAWETRSS